MIIWCAWNISLVEHILPRHSHQVLMLCSVIGPKWRYLFLLVYVLFQMTTAVTEDILDMHGIYVDGSLAASLPNSSFLFISPASFSCVFPGPFLHAHLLRHILLLLLLSEYYILFLAGNAQMYKTGTLLNFKDFLSQKLGNKARWTSFIYEFAVNWLLDNVNCHYLFLELKCTCCIRAQRLEIVSLKMCNFQITKDAFFLNKLHNDNVLMSCST